MGGVSVLVSRSYVAPISWTAPPATCLAVLISHILRTQSLFEEGKHNVYRVDGVQWFARTNTRDGGQHRCRQRENQRFSTLKKQDAVSELACQLAAPMRKLPSMRGLFATRHRPRIPCGKLQKEMGVVASGTMRDFVCSPGSEGELMGRRWAPGCAGRRRSPVRKEIFLLFGY